MMLVSVGGLGTASAVYGEGFKCGVNIDIE